jgi:ADP-ribose pyrophosphatase YjhB (NUDIX family)
MKNYFASTKENPYHLSVGAVVLNEKDEVLCHHFSSVEVEGNLIEDLYLLMRETVYENEALEVAIKRGLKEEFGAEVEIEKYLGPIVSAFPRDGEQIEKTTLYFLCKLKLIDESKRDKNDPESVSEIKFLPMDELIEKMNSQEEKYHRTDVNEAKILERIK